MAKFQKKNASSRYYASGNVSFTDRTTEKRIDAKSGDVIDPIDSDFESLMKFGAITDKSPLPQVDASDVAGDDGLSEL